MTRTPHVLAVLGGFCDGSPTSGAQMRRHHILIGLLGAATVDVVVTRELTRAEIERMQAYYRSTVRTVADAGGPVIARHLCRIPARLSEPTPLLDVLRSHGGAYDIVFIERIHDFLRLRGALEAPSIVDLDDLQSQLVGQKRRLLLRAVVETEPTRRLAAVPARLRPLARIAMIPLRHAGLTRDLRRWRRAEREVLLRATAVLVASEDDRRSLGSPTNCVLVPNGYEADGPPVGRLEVETPPVLGFWGSFDYHPNADGARWFVREVLPQVRSVVPDVRLRLIGKDSELLGVDGKGIDATGVVDRMAAELAAVDVAVVPLRLGAGTRVKIIEAWEHQIPVVSTTIGAHGLAPAVGVDCLIADRADTFAGEVVRAIEDLDLRRRLRISGAERATKLRWSHSERQVRDVVARLAARPVYP